MAQALGRNLGAAAGLLRRAQVPLGYWRAGWIMLLVSLPGSLFSFGIASLVMSGIALVEGGRCLALSPEEFRRLYIDGRREWF